MPSSTLRLEDTPIMKRTLAMPKDWSGLIASGKKLEEQYESMRHKPNDLQEWSRKVEDAVNQTIREEAQENTPGTLAGLPPAYRGRCQPRKEKIMPQLKPCRRARHGEYEPPEECAQMKTLRLTKQTRRVQSLRVQLENAFHRGTFKQGQWRTISQEWAKITRSPAFEGGLRFWSTANLGLELHQNNIPDLHQLYAMEQCLRHITDAEILAYKKKEDNCRKYAMQVDKTSGANVQAHKAIRPPAHPPITQTWSETTQEAEWAPQDTDIIAYVEDGNAYATGEPILLGDFEGTVIETHWDRV